MGDEKPSNVGSLSDTPHIRSHTIYTIFEASITTQMSQKQKRQPQPEREEEEDDEGNMLNSDRRKRKVPALRRIVMEAVKMDALDEFSSLLEPMVRRVVKEEVQSVLTEHLDCIARHKSSEIYTYSAARAGLQLQFANKLSVPIFSGSKIEAEDCSAINISLRNSLMGQIVMSRPESSLKVEIVVLEGDFDGNDDKGSWTFEEFKNSIVTAREGKRSLLVGDVNVELNGGVGIVQELSFTDNSSWTRSRRFRLGAMVVGGEFNGMRIVEATTEPFTVRDHRGELYKKHHPPALWDEVWRLEKIGKDGAFHKRLSRAGIITVKDFLTLLHTDVPRLQNILGSGMSSKMWEITVQHARTCTLNSMKYVYYPSSQKETGVVFNVVGELVGVLSQNQYISANDLSDDEKADAQTLVKAAYDHKDEVLSFDMGSVAGSPSHSPLESIPPSPQYYLGDVHQRLPNPLIPSYNIIDIENEPEFSSLSSLDIYDDDLLPEFCSFDDNACLLSPSLLMGSPADLGTAVTAFIAASTSSAVAHVKANNGGWNTLVSVLRWTLSIKRIVASKKGGLHGKDKN